MFTKVPSKQLCSVSHGMTLKNLNKHFEFWNTPNVIYPNLVYSEWFWSRLFFFILTWPYSTKFRKTRFWCTHWFLKQSDWEATIFFKSTYRSYLKKEGTNQWHYLIKYTYAILSYIELLLASRICMANRNYRGLPLTPVLIYRERLGTWSLWGSRGRWECSRGSRLRFPANGRGDGSCLEALCSPGRPSIVDPSWKYFASLNASPQCTWK